MLDRINKIPVYADTRSALCSRKIVFNLNGLCDNRLVGNVRSGTHSIVALHANLDNAIIDRHHAVSYFEVLLKKQSTPHQSCIAQQMRYSVSETVYLEL